MEATADIVVPQLLAGEFLTRPRYKLYGLSHFHSLDAVGAHLQCLSMMSSIFVFEIHGQKRLNDRWCAGFQQVQSS